MATEVKLDAQLLFEGGETKNISLSPFRPTSSAVNGFKARVMEINDSEIEKTFSSITLDGQPVQKVKEATITSTTATVVYAKTETARVEALKAVTGEGE